MENTIPHPPVLSYNDILEALTEAGVARGHHLMVHTSLKSLGYVCGGAQTILEALFEATGPGGTIMMPTQSWKNLDPATGVHWEVPEGEWQKIRDHWPAYDKSITPANSMGAVAEMFRQWPGTLRSDHPARSVAAWGRHAEYLTAEHDLGNIFGEGSPLDRLSKIGGRVLMLGVGYDKCTALHLADARASYPSKRLCTESSAMFVDGKRQWCSYETLYVDGEDFNEIGEAFEQNQRVTKVTLGAGTVRYLIEQDLVDFAVQWIEKHRT